MNKPQTIQLLDGTIFKYFGREQRCDQSGLMVPVFESEADPSRVILLHDCGDWFNGEASWLAGDDDLFFTNESEDAVRSSDGSLLIEARIERDDVQRVERAAVITQANWLVCVEKNDSKEYSKFIFCGSKEQIEAKAEAVYGADQTGGLSWQKTELTVVPVLFCPRCGHEAQEVGRYSFIEVGEWDSGHFEGETDAEEYHCSSCQTAFHVEV